MGCTANRLSQGRAHVGDHAWAWTDERFWYPTCDNSSHRSLLWWWHPIFSTWPILLTSWYSCWRENHHLSLSLSLSLPETSAAALLFTTASAKYQIPCTIYSEPSDPKHQCSLPSAITDIWDYYTGIELEKTCSTLITMTVKLEN